MINYSCIIVVQLSGTIIINYSIYLFIMWSLNLIIKTYNKILISIKYLFFFNTL